MSEAIETYLDRVMICANLPKAQADDVRAEQRDHLEEKIERLTATGLPREDAIFRAIDQHGDPRIVGYALRRWRWVDVRTHGTAHGFIAIGPRAVGVIAMGGAACGVFAVGGVAVGAVSFGGIAAALAFTIAGLGLALGMAYCGVAVALVAMGGLALGVVAAGGWAEGALAMGGMQHSIYTHDQAPRWIAQLFDRFLPATPGSQGALIMATLALFGLAMGMMLMWQWREARRLRAGGVVVSG